MKKFIRVLSILLIIAVIVFSGYNFFKKKNSDDASEQTEKQVNIDGGKSDEAPLPVRVVKITKGELPLRLEVSAVSEVRQKATVKAELTGKILEIRKHIGDYVQKGDIIIKIDDTEKKLALKDAEAQRLQALSKYLVNSMNLSFNLSEKDKTLLKNRKKDYEEMLRKYKKGDVSELELHDSEDELLKVMIETGAMRDKVRKVVMGLTQAEIKLARARIDYERTSIKAPFSGIISEMKISEGETVSAGAEIFRIVNLNSLYLKAYALETESSKIKVGMKVRIKFTSFPDKHFYGRIKAISPELSEKEETLPVYISLNNPGYLRAGMRAEAEIEYKILKDVIKVPRKSILVRSERPLVFVVENNIALWRYIEMGDQNSEEVEVRSGVEEGEFVIVEGQLTLAHQSKVKILK
jgi:HlyD family secretion protein